tara:strand:+ start:227 stop:1330 length:1104 start_codon:yes stop_codon:yes gene_type:complete
MTTYAPKRTTRRQHSRLETPNLNLIRSVNPKLSNSQINNGIFCRISGFYIGHNNLFNNQPLYTLHPVITLQVSTITSLLPKAKKHQEQHVLLLAMLYQLGLLDTLSPLKLAQTTITEYFPKVAIVWLSYTKRGHIMEAAKKLPQFMPSAGTNIADYIETLLIKSVATNTLTDQRIDYLLGGASGDYLTDSVDILQAKFAGKIRATGYHPDHAKLLIKDLELDTLTSALVSKSLNGQGIPIDSLVTAFNILKDHTQHSTSITKIIKPARQHLITKINKSVAEQNGLGLYDTLRFNSETGIVTSTPVTFEMLSEGIADSAAKFARDKANGIVSATGDAFEASTPSKTKVLDLGLNKPRPLVAGRKRIQL